MGIRGSATCELIFENLQIPKENLLGKEGQGFQDRNADTGRRIIIGVASQALGLAEGAIDECVKYVMERKQFGKKIGQMQNTQFELADMAAKVEAVKLLVYEACTKDAHGALQPPAAMAKCTAGATASDVTRRCVQLFGGYGYTRDYPIERMMRDAKITEIYEGTAEVQKIVIFNWMKLK